LVAGAIGASDNDIARTDVTVQRYDDLMERTIAVFGASRSLSGDPHFEEAVLCGQLLARAGFAVATGGYAGTMEAVSQGARLAGGHVIGVTAPSVFPGRIGANEYVVEERKARSIVERMSLLIEESDGAIALWGSLGTATELLVAWNIAFVAPFSGGTRKPIVAVGEPWISIIPSLEESLGTDTGIVTVTDSVAEAVHHIATALG
jgi:uncharacterized protein (TIGR00725 family)